MSSLGTVLFPSIFSSPSLLNSCPDVCLCMCVCVHFIRLQELPESIGGLVRLEVMDVECNRLTRLSLAIDKLTNLKALNLSSNQCVTSVSSIYCLIVHNFAVCCAAVCCRLDMLPRSLGALTQLQVLRADNNNIQRVSAGLSTLSELQILSLINNDLRCVFVIALCFLPWILFCSV